MENKENLTEDQPEELVLCGRCQGDKHWLCDGWLLHNANRECDCPCTPESHPGSECINDDEGSHYAIDDRNVERVAARKPTEGDKDDGPKGHVAGCFGCGQGGGA